MKLLGLIAKQFQAMQRKTYAYHFALWEGGVLVRPCVNLAVIIREHGASSYAIVKFMLYGVVCDDQHARAI
jgi:hypothetical protein